MKRNRLGKFRALLLSALFVCLGVCSFSPKSQASVLAICHRTLSELGGLSPIEYFIAGSRELILPIKNRKRDPSIPSVETLHLPEEAPQRVRSGGPLSPGLSDPLLEEARQLGIFEDNKPRTADVRERLHDDGTPLTAQDRERIQARAVAAQRTAIERLGAGATRAQRDLEGRRAFLRSYINDTYISSNELLPVTGQVTERTSIESGRRDHDALYAYNEAHWEALLRMTRAQSTSSLLPAPYPLFVANPERFGEAYYWDTYFTMMGFLAPVRRQALQTARQRTLANERLRVAQGVVENLLHFVERYGHVPNGNRDYYLTRSQPPFLSSMVREVYALSLRVTPERQAHIRKWLKERALPLLKREYEFWMSQDRYDARTGLNHHWDIDLDRPERHGNDNEATLGKTRRDVRSAAESGEDFSDAHQGEASNIAPVLLNSMLYKMERDIEWLAGEVGNREDVARFRGQAEQRQRAIRTYLYNPQLGRYENYFLGNNDRPAGRIPILIADTFAPLFAGVSTQEEAAAVRRWLAGAHGRPGLERPFGIMSSELTSSQHQWDGENGWAPHQMMAMQGLMNYRFEADARRIGTNFVNANAGILRSTGGLSERINVQTGTIPPVDGHKYPVQTGPFGWAQGVSQWTLLEVLGHAPRPR